MGRGVRLWKWELQKLADETELHIGVCHFPPGTSKWNKIEHRLFSAISQNWRGKPLVNHEVIINLISATTTKNGLRVESELDTNLYPKGIKILTNRWLRYNCDERNFMETGTTASFREALKMRLLFPDAFLVPGSIRDLITESFLSRQPVRCSTSSQSATTNSPRIQSAVRSGFRVPAPFRRKE